jgi:molecular chaperone IbpA
MTNKALSIFNQLRPVSVGFDSIFDHFEKMFDDDDGFRFPLINYPPYNIVKTGTYTYDIEVALAGYNKKEISVEYADGVLNIKSIKEEKSEDKKGVIHKGIAKRYFSKSFTIADDVKIEGAELKDGLLKVSLMKIIPEGKKPKTITVK